MRWLTNQYINAGVTLLLGLMSTLGYSQVTANGSETLVNTTTADNQQRPEMAMDTSGNYVVVWESHLEDGDDYGIYAQLYNSDGTTNGGQITISQTTAGAQRSPDVDMDDNGDFTVVWMSYGEDNDGWGVYARRYNSDGTAKANDWRVNSTQTGNQMHPRVAVDDDGDIWFVWSDDDGDGFGVRGRHYTSAGAATSSPYWINTTTAGHQAHPDIACDANGNFTVVWQSHGQDGDGKGIFAQQFDNTRTMVGSEFQVNATTAENQQEPSIAMDDAGNFMVTWTSYNQDGDHHGIYGQIYNSSASVTVSEFAVNTTTTNSQDHPSVSVIESGNYTVAWTSWAQDGDKGGVYTRSFQSDGNEYQAEELVNTRTNDYQQFPTVGGREQATNMAIAWQDGLRNSASTNDGGNYGVYVQNYGAADVTPPNAVCQDITVYLDGTGNASITTGDIDNGSTDNIGITSYSLDISSFTCAEVGANTVTLTVEDAAANSDNCTATVTVVDSTSPTAVCQDITVYLDGAGSATITAGDVDGGSTDNCAVTAQSLDVSSFTCANIGVNVVTLTVEDAATNSDNCTANVTVADTTSPTAVCQNITVYLDGTGNASITAADIDNGSTDNCGAVSLSADITAFTCANVGANNVTLTADDGNGNTSQCVAVVTVSDTVSPTAVCQNITVYLDGAGNASITAADIDNGSTDNCGAVNLSADITAFTCANIGANNVTLTATDNDSNTSQCVAVVTVQDTVSPTAVCQNITAYLDGTGNVTIVAADIDNGSTDNCGSVSLSASQTTFTCANTGANNVTLTVDDGNGNSAQCVAVVTVSDTVSPTVSGCPADIFINTNNVGCTGIATWITPTGNDNCGTPSSSSTHNSGDVFPVGVTTVTYTFTDGSGNTTLCTFDVTVTNDLAMTASSTDVLCNGNSDGTASALPTGGTSPYTYDWDNDGTGDFDDPQTINGLIAGTYNITVQDANGCTVADVAVVSEPASALSATTSSTDETCATNDGTATATPAGGTAPYTYSWDDPGAQTTATATGLANGNYNVTVTDANGCNVVESVTVFYNCGGTKLRDYDCGSTLPTFDKYFYADQVSGADAYEWELMDYDDNSIYTWINYVNHSAKMIYFSGTTYGKTYRVRVRARVGGVWGTLGVPCDLSTPAVTLTQLRAYDCNSTLNSMTQYFYADAVTGASAYEFELTDTDDFTVYNWTNYNNRSAQMSLISGTTTNKTYDVRVRALVGGTWTSYGTTCQLTTPGIPLTQLKTQYCGLTLPSFNYLFLCYPVPGVTDFEWEFYDTNTMTTEYYVKGNNNEGMIMNLLSNPQINTTYEVRVRAQVGGTWGAFGPMCLLHTGPNAMAPQGDGEQAHRFDPQQLMEREEISILIYPNPARDQFTLGLKEIDENTMLRIFNGMGQIVVEQRITTLNETINISTLANGIYTIQVASKNNVIADKLLIER